MFKLASWVSSIWKLFKNAKKLKLHVENVKLNKALKPKRSKIELFMVLS